MYFISITNGCIEFTKTSNPAKNPKQYFQAKSTRKPPAVRTPGWPFSKMFITAGDEENGLAVAWD